MVNVIISSMSPPFLKILATPLPNTEWRIFFADLVLWIELTFPKYTYIMINSGEDTHTHLNIADAVLLVGLGCVHSSSLHLVLAAVKTNDFGSWKLSNLSCWPSYTTTNILEEEKKNKLKIQAEK